MSTRDPPHWYNRPAFGPSLRGATSVPGIELRDLFAGLVAAGLAANPNYHQGGGVAVAARDAYVVADAMLAERGSKS